MMKLFFCLLLSLCQIVINAQQAKPKVMMIFAHPDEGEVYMGGITSLYTSMGCEVKFLSLTNGDRGHHLMQPKELAKRRYKEAMKAKEILGLKEYEIFNYHDGNLKNKKKIRKEVIENINAWEPDLVFTYYPAEGGHNDNMTAGYIVREAAQSLAINKPTLFMYVRDFHTYKFAYIPDIAIDITSVWQNKLAALGAHESQVLEFNAYGKGQYDEVQASKKLQEEYLYTNAYDWSHITPENFITLEYWYGKENAKSIKFVESFEFAEFGLQITLDKVYFYFPMITNE